MNHRSYAGGFLPALESSLPGALPLEWSAAEYFALRTPNSPLAYANGERMTEYVGAGVSSRPAELGTLLGRNRATQMGSRP